MLLKYLESFGDFFLFFEIDCVLDFTWSLFFSWQIIALYINKKQGYGEVNVVTGFLAKWRGRNRSM